MLDQLIQYLGSHPGVLTAIGLTALLAAVGLWYVVAHHLQAIMITLLTAAGIGSGLLVLYRGFRADMKDLMGIGLFLIVIFPVIFWQAIKQLEPSSLWCAPAARRPRAPSTAARAREYHAAFVALTAMETSSVTSARTPFRRSAGRSHSPLNTSR